MVYRIETLLDVLFPPRPTELLARTLSDQPFPTGDPRRTNHCWYLATYQKAPVQAAIIENKFHHNREAAKWLATGLQKWLDAQSTKVVFVPIPLGPKRQRERGHNQVESVLKALADNGKVAHLLVRHRETRPQSKLEKTNRLENIQAAFRCKETLASELRETHVVLLDDVVTTGATMAAARATLAPHLHPSVTLTCLAIAH